MKSAVSHIQNFGDATMSSAGDAAFTARDVSVGAEDVHL
jgi:hypothetical protein